MRGLLNLQHDPQPMGLLGPAPDGIALGLADMGAALLTPRRNGGGVGAALQAFPRALLSAQELERKREQDALRAKFLQAQMGEFEAQAGERRERTEALRAERERQERIRNRLMPGSSFHSTAPDAPRAAPEMNLPMHGMSFLQAGQAQKAGALPMLPQQGGTARPSRMDGYNQFLRFAEAHEAEGDFAGGQKYREMAQKALPEVKDRTRVVRNGKVMYELLFKDGTREAIEDVAPTANVELSDFGGFKRGFDKDLGRLTGAELPKTMTPGDVQQAKDAAAGRSVTIRGQNLTDARGRELAEITREQQALERAHRMALEGDRRTDAGVTDLSKQLDAAKAPQVGASIRNLNAILSRYTPEDVPGVGYAKNLPLATMLLSPEGKEVKSAISSVANDLMAMYSGLAVTLPEAERRALEEMRDGKFSAQDFYTAWPRTVARYNQVTGNITAGAKPEVVQRYSQRPGAMNLDPVLPTQGRGRAPAAPFAPGSTAAPPSGGVIDFSTLKR